MLCAPAGKHACVSFLIYVRAGVQLRAGHAVTDNDIIDFDFFLWVCFVQDTGH